MKFQRIVHKSNSLNSLLFLLLYDNDDDDDNNEGLQLSLLLSVFLLFRILA